MATAPAPQRMPDATREALQASWHTRLRLLAFEVTDSPTPRRFDAADELARPPALRPVPVTKRAAGRRLPAHPEAAADPRRPAADPPLSHLTVAEARIAHTLADHCHRAQTAGIDHADALTHWRMHAHNAECLANTGATSPACTAAATASC